MKEEVMIGCVRVWGDMRWCEGEKMKRVTGKLRTDIKIQKKEGEGGMERLLCSTCA